MLACCLGVFIGQLNFHAIVVIAIPALMFIYPITIVLILLNILPKTLATHKVFKAVVFTTIVFSFPDFLTTIGFAENTVALQNYIPLNNYSLGWVLPAITVFILMNLWNSTKKIL